MLHQTFKSAAHDTIFRSSLPAKALADIVGVSYSALTKFADESVDEQIPMRRFIALIRVADNLAALDYLEQLAGRVAFKVPAGAHAVTLGEAVARFGEWMRTHGQALEDGAISSAELEASDQAFRAATAAMASAMAQARAQVTRPPSPLKAIR